MTNQVWVVECRLFPRDPWTPLLQFCYHCQDGTEEFRSGVYYTRDQARVAAKSFHSNNQMAVEYRARKYLAQDVAR